MILTVVNARFDYHIGSLGDTELAFDGEYDDFTASWYNVVGLSLMLTMLLSVVRA